MCCCRSSPYTKSCIVEQHLHWCEQNNREVGARLGEANPNATKSNPGYGKGLWTPMNYVETICWTICGASDFNWCEKENDVSIVDDDSGSLDTVHPIITHSNLTMSENALPVVSSLLHAFGGSQQKTGPSEIPVDLINLLLVASWITFQNMIRRWYFPFCSSGL